MADLKYSDDALAEAQRAQEEIFDTDPLAAAQLDIEPVEDLGFGEVETPKGDRVPAEDYSEGQEVVRPDADEPTLPFGDYDPEDIRMQIVQGRYGRQDGNYYEFVRERFQSGDNPPTAAEVTKASQEAAEVAYQQVYGRGPKNMRDPDFQELTLQFEKLYGQQRDLMSEQGALTPGEEAKNPAQETANRVAATFKSAGLEPEDVYDFYEKQLVDRGKFDQDTTPAMRDQAVIDAMMVDLKAQGADAADMFRIRAQLQMGNWEGLRRTEEGPFVDQQQIDAMTSAAEQQRQAEAEAEEAATPSVWSRIFGGGDEEEETATADAPQTFPLLLDLDDGLMSDENIEAMRAAATSADLSAAYTSALDAVRSPDATLSEDAADAARRLAMGLIDMAGSVSEAGAIYAPAAEESSIRTFGGGGLSVPDRLARMEVLEEALRTGASLADQELAESMSERNPLRDELMDRGLSDAERDVISQEYQTLADSVRRSQAIAPASERRGFETAADIRNWRADTFGVPNPENDDAIWAQVSEGLGNAAGFVATSYGPGGLARGAFMGATLSASGAYKQAIDRGATEAEATEAAGLMAMAGMSEVVPITRMLDRLPVSVRGGVRRRVANYLGDVVKQGGEEALQEGVQTVLDNIVSQNVYDWEGDTWDGVGESATVGGIVGILLAGTLGAPGAIRGDTDSGLSPEDQAALDEAEAALSGLTPTPEDVARTAEVEEDFLAQAEEAQQSETGDDVDALLADVLQPVDAGAAVEVARSSSDAPEGTGTVDPEELLQRQDIILQEREEREREAREEDQEETTEDIIRTIAEGRSEPARQRVMATDDPDGIVPDNAAELERAEAAAGGITPTQDEVVAARASIAEIEELQGQVDAGLTTLSKFDREALSVVTNSARSIINNADTAYTEAREAVSAALGADIDAPAQAPAPPQGRRGTTAQRRAAQERQAQNALAQLRGANDAPAAPDASLIGVLAGLPRSVAYTMASQQLPNEAGVGSDPIGSTTMRQDLRLGSRADPPDVMIHNLQTARESLQRYDNMLSSVSLENVPGNPELAQRLSVGRAVEGEPMRQLLLDRAFRGADATQIDQIDMVSLASADDATLNRWATASTAEDLADFPGGSMLSDARPGVAATPAGRDTVATQAVRGTPSGNAGIARKIARAVIDTRAAQKKTRRALEQIDRSVNVLGVVSGLTDTNTDVGSFVRAVRANAQDGATDAVALRQALRDHAPSLLEDGAMPIREMARIVGQANANLPVDMRVDRGPLARAYESTLAVEDLFGNNWRARRVSRQADQRSVVSTVESVLALTPESDPLDVQQAREELGAMAVAEHLLSADQIPALQDAIENMDSRSVEDRSARNRALIELRERIAESEAMTDEQYAEMLVNEFSLDEDAAVAVVMRGKEMAAAARGDGDAIRSVNEGADELLGTIRFHRGEDRRGMFVDVDPDGIGVEGFPQEPVVMTPGEMQDADRELTTTRLDTPGVRHMPGVGLDRAAVYVQNLAHKLGFKGGITIVPMTDWGDSLPSFLDPSGPDQAYLQMLSRYISEDVLSGQGAYGMAAHVRKNAYVMALNVDSSMSDGDIAAVAAHEFGHIVMQSMILDTTARSPKTMDMLRRAYEESGYSTTMREVGYFPRERARQDDIMIRRDGDYANEFYEWFASRVGESLVTQGTSTPTGLVQRLIHNVARMWRTILATLRQDHMELGRIATSRMIQQSVRNGLPLEIFTERQTRSDRSRLGLPEDRLPTEAQQQTMASEEVRQLQEPGEVDTSMADTMERTQSEMDWDDIPFSRGIHHSRPANRANTPLTAEQQTELKQAFAGMTSDTGVKIRVVNPDRISLPDRAALGDRGVAYRPPPKAGMPSVIVVNPNSYSSVAAAAKDVELQLVTQHGLHAALGSDVAARLNTILANPKDANIDGPTKRRLTKMRNKVRRDLTIDGVPPADATVAQAMLAKMADEHETGNYTDANKAAVSAIRGALEVSNRVPLDAQHIAALMSAAQHHGSGAPSTLQGPPLSNKQKSALTDVFDGSYANAQSRERRKEPSANTREVLDRSRGQRVYDAMFDYMMPVIRIGRIGRQIGGEAGERLSKWATELSWRSKMYQSEMNRVIVSQQDVHANFDSALDDMAGRLGYTDRALMRAHINLFHTARASIERNENNALVYGRLDNEALEADRLEILTRYDEAVQAVQGDNRRRTSDSFMQIEELRAQQIGELRALILDPNAPNTPVRQQILASREGRSPFSSESWADVSGATTRFSLEIVNRLEQSFDGKWVQAFRESGVDGRIRRLVNQTYHNRIMSGIYGASGELYISRLGLRHHTPMRGMGVSEGAVRHDHQEFGLGQHDVAYYGSLQRSPGTRLAPTQDLRRYSDRFKLTDVLDVAAQDYMSSIREMTTNHQVGALIGLSQALDDVGVAEGLADPDRRPITVSREIPFLVWIDPKNPSSMFELPAPGRERVINPQITRARQVVSEDGRTGSLLHALPNGNYQIVQINDPAIYKAMTFRFQRGSNNVAADTILRSLGTITRVNARTFTSWALPFTTLRAFTRDLQENADLMLFERNVSAARTAELPVRAARMVVPLERFFQSGPERRQELIRKWSAKKSHPMNGFARRWRAGYVQLYAQQLELATDRRRAEGATGRAVQAASGLVDKMLTPLTWAEAHADAMENSVRQAASDIIEAQLIRDGVDPEEAAITAFRDVINVLNFGQRSALGEALAPVHAFAQTTLTGTHVLLDRRLWRNGEPPMRTQGVTEDGQLQSQLDWSAVAGSIHWPRMGAWSAVGFLNTMFASFGLGLWTGEGDDDEIDEEAKDRIAKIRDTTFGPDPGVEARSIVLRGLDAGLRRLLDDPDAEASDLRMLRPSTVFSGLLLPWQDEDMQGRMPISYGVQSIGVNVGQAAALMVLGHDLGDVAGALGNSVLRNITPLEAPYNEEAPTNVENILQLFIPSIAATVYEFGFGQTLDGVQLSAQPFTEVGGQSSGWVKTPSMTGATQLNELFADIGLYLQQGGNDLGLPSLGLGWVESLAQRFIPSGRRAENMADYIPLIGAPMADAFRELDKQMTGNAAEGDPLFSFGDAAAVATRTILEDGGFLSMDPRRSAQASFYKEANWSGWDTLTEYRAQDERYFSADGRKFDDYTFLDYQKAQASIIGVVHQELGKRKKEYSSNLRAMTRADTPQERMEAGARADEILTGMNAIYREAAAALRTMREQVDLTAPNIIPAD